MRALALVLLAACSTQVQEATRVERRRHEDRFLVIARRRAEEAIEKSVGCRPDDAYLSMRRAIAAAKALWRITEPRGAEVLLGPLRSTSEGGGALGQLDAAMEAGNCVAAADRLLQVRSSLRFIAVSRTAPAPEDVSRALSES